MLFIYIYICVHLPSNIHLYYRYISTYIRGAYDKFLEFFAWAFKMVVDS